MVNTLKNWRKILQYIFPVYFVTILIAPLLYFSTRLALVNPSRLISYDLFALWLFSVFYGLLVCPPVLLIAYFVVKYIDRSQMTLQIKKVLLCVFSLIVVALFCYMFFGIDDRYGIDYNNLMLVYTSSAIASIIFFKLPSLPVNYDLHSDDSTDNLCRLLLVFPAAAPLHGLLTNN